MSNRIELVEPALQQENITEAKENLLEGEKGLYLFHEHFSCFGHDHGPNNNQVSKYQPADLCEADTYRYEFNVAMFFKSLLVFLLDIFGLGLPIVLFTALCGFKFLGNLHWIETGVYILIYGCINTLLLSYSIYHGEFIFTDATTLLYLTGLVFYAIIGASFNSFINRKIPPLLENVELSLESRSNTGIAPLATEYGPQSELRRTILRLNIDASLFFFTFLENTGGESQFFKTGLARPATGFKEEEHMLIWDKQFNKADLITKALEFEKRVFNYKFLGQYTRYDKSKAHALSYADTVLGRYKRKSRDYRLFAISVCFGLAALSFMRLDSSDNSAESFVNRFIIKGGILLINILVTVLVLIEVLKGAAVLGTRLDLVKGLGELISEEKPAQDSIFRENCSMINIFDPESLRTWASLRMVFMNMNSRRLDATSLGTSLIVAIQLIGLITLGFLYFTSEGQEKKAFFLQYIIFFGIPTLIYMMFVLFFIYFGSQVNNQYQEHIYLLKKLKMTIFKLFAMYPILDGEDGVQPSTYLYARGFRYLKQSFEGQEITKEALDEKLQKINEAYEEIIEELETEEKYSPLKLLGIPMTDSFVNTLLGSILTVMMIPVTNYLSDLTGWG